MVGTKLRRYPCRRNKTMSPCHSDSRDLSRRRTFHSRCPRAHSGQTDRQGSATQLQKRSGLPCRASRSVDGMLLSAHQRASFLSIKNGIEFDRVAVESASEPRHSSAVAVYGRKRWRRLKLNRREMERSDKNLVLFVWSWRAEYSNA
jgi:hypothetical protein